MNKALDNLTTELTQIVSEAEKAVSNLADSELKQLAFDRILEHLLQTGLPKSVEEPKKVKVSKPKPEKVSSSKLGPKTWIQELADEDFFKSPRAINAIRDALDERGHILSAQDLTRPLASLVNEKALRRKKMPVEDGGKTQVHWFNW